jgi:hypothetical protein
MIAKQVGPGTTIGRLHTVLPGVHCFKVPTRIQVNSPLQQLQGHVAFATAAGQQHHLLVMAT